VIVREGLRRKYYGHYLIYNPSMYVDEFRKIRKFGLDYPVVTPLAAH